MGLGLRWNHPSMDLRHDVPTSGRTLWDIATCIFNSNSHSPVVHHLDVLRRWIRHHACFYCRLLWIEERRSNLRPDAHCMGIRERIWAITHRTHATEQRLICRRPPCHCHHHGRLNSSSYPGLTPKNCHGKGRGFTLRHFRDAFKVTYPEWIAVRAALDFGGRPDSG